jgi:hypothetical protein
MLPFIPLFFNGLFSYILPIIRYVAPSGGGVSDGSASVPDIHTAPTPGPAQIITGASSDLGRNTIAFSVAKSITVNTTGTGSLAIDLFAERSLTAHCHGRLSATIGPTILSVIPIASTTATVVFATGAVAIRGLSRTPDLVLGEFGTIESLLKLPYSQPVLATQMGESTVPLVMPPGIQTNVLINQIIGRNPVILIRVQALGANTVIVRIAGNVTVDGIGERPAADF